MAAQLDVLGIDAPADPDAQAIVTDFLDYTEYLPSDLIRSLTLIGKLDESYLSSTDKVHRLSENYGSLPNKSPNERQDPQELRQQISHNLDHAISAREFSFAEASRLYDVVDRHCNRLASIISKLRSLPKPPSRDPTPAVQTRSPQATRAKPLMNGVDGNLQPKRITLRLDSARAAASATRVSGPTTRPRHRSQKVTVPGEVLPPPNPPSPPHAIEPEWEFKPPSPVPIPTSRVGDPARSRPTKPVRIRPPKPPKEETPKLLKTPRPPRPPGAMGTNVHSAVAGISTSNALSLLEPPPVDAKPGSEHAPWMRLTEWEMAKLRKRMKKNAIWSPSETMIRRELSDAGRGPENYRSCKARADAAGEEFLDMDHIANAPPGKPLAPGEISADSLGLEETQLSNRGMKLNEAKKLKREIIAREQAALAAAEAEHAAKRLGDVNSTFRHLFSKPPEETTPAPLKPSSLLNPKDPNQDKEKAKTKAKDKAKAKDIPKLNLKKRKVDDALKTEIATAPSDVLISPSKQSPKKRKAMPAPALPLSINTSIVTKATTTIPLSAPAPSPPLPVGVAPAAPPPSPADAPKSAALSTRSRRLSLNVRGSAAPAEPPANSSRPPSRAASRRASTGPPSATLARAPSRRTSATPGPLSTPVITAAGRRSKRPAPGPVTSNHEGGAAVSEGRRRNAPRKRGISTAVMTKKAVDGSEHREREDEVRADEEAAGEEIDPDEPRYCVCGDVSFGTMICCENAEVSALLKKKFCSSICFPP